MRVLFLDWPCFGRTHAINAFASLGYEVVLFSHAGYQDYQNDDFLKEFTLFTQNTDYAFCFSFNYFPVMAEACCQRGYKYVSFVYDSPYAMMYSYTLIYETNYVFLFDSVEYRRFHDSGLNTVYYLPLPAAVYPESFLTSAGDKLHLKNGVSFVGSLYHETHNLFDRLLSSSDAYLAGYLNGIMAAQQQLTDYNFIEELLTPDILNRLQKACPFRPAKGSAETPQYIYANYFINRKITQLERQRLLGSAASHFGLNLFTLDKNYVLPNATNFGPVDYHEQMPRIFHCSGINLNITLRSISAGIPLRCMDIMGAGGFLLTDYRPDFSGYFTPGEDFDFFTGEAELLSKIEYYLAHPAKRQAAARSAYEKVKAGHSYPRRFQQMIEIIGG